MKVVAFNGSPNGKGNTYHALKLVAEELEKENIEVEIVHVGNKSISGCLACNKCVKNKNEKCILTGDSVNEWIQKMKEADGIIFGSPVHFASIAGNMKSFLDRAFYVSGFNNSMFRHKVAASVVVVRRTGGLPTFNQLNNYINYGEMVMPSSNYWNVIHGTKPGDVLMDEEGVQSMRILGENMSWLMKSIENGQDSIKAPELKRKKYTDFIR
jgi:multimeric flavodoxin WrbA